MIVAIDAGNTRIKWGLFDGTRWLARDALPTPDAEGLSAIVGDWPDDVRVVACSVAGEAVEHKIAAALAHRQVHWLRSSAEACGVRNLYEQPGQLGADRWAALIGARGKATSDCLVVCAGTATTIDRLDAEGNFRGGVILPGFELMRAALASNTAQLPLAQGGYRDEPRNTMDAIVSGCLQAQVGAVERCFAAIAEQPQAVCLLTGGAAPLLAPHLTIPYRIEESLILDGLVRYIASR